MERERNGERGEIKKREGDREGEKQRKVRKVRGEGRQGGRNGEEWK